jgi:exopolysaccharide biosynthesis WecB/TagA/CpsF family protein
LKILIVTQYFWPEQFRINEVAKDFLKRGYSVDVITGEPNYPDGKIFDEYRKNKKKFAKFFEVNVFRVPIIIRGDASPLRLFLNYLSFIFSAILIGAYKLRNRNYDIIFTFATSPITSALPSIFFSFIKNAKHVLWVLDIWPYILKELNIIKNKFLFLIIEKIVDYIYNKSDLILAQSKSFREIILNRIKNKEKVLYFPSWSEELQKISKFNIGNDEVFNKNKFNIVFTGNVGEAQNFDNILIAAEILKDYDNIQWIIVGTGRKLEEINKLIKKKKINNFCILGHKPISDISYYHQLANILLISLSPGKYLSSTIPGKFQTYLESNKFILGFINGETAKLIEETKTGVHVNSSNPQLLAKTIINLSQNPTIINNFFLKNTGTKYIKKHFNKETLLNKLSFDLIKTLEEFKIIKDIKNIPLNKNFSLSGLNLAFLGYFARNKIKMSKDTYLWPDGFFFKRFFNLKSIKKIPGREIINNLKLSYNIKRIFILGNLEHKSKEYLSSLYKKEIIHVDLGYGDIEEIYRKRCNIKFLQTDLIYLTLPTPKQEQFSELIMKNNKFYKILCVGGAINMASGLEKPVPDFLEKLNLEFLWRLRTDTKRRIKRLIVSGLYYAMGEFFFKFKNLNKKIIGE